MSEIQTDDTGGTAKKRARKDKLAPPTAQEILDKAKREARPTTPAEKRRLEQAGQMLMPGHLDLPHLTATALSR
ncbi:hypothetical protein ACQKJ1_05300 [Methylorubrum rhodesianum]|uniref:hypothetical protein n=1 Tax=Methylorubrum rhodesianum TaxID=29427 RepID=UPI003D03B707